MLPLSYLCEAYDFFFFFFFPDQYEQFYKELNFVK